MAYSQTYKAQAIALVEQEKAGGANWDVACKNISRRLKKRDGKGPSVPTLNRWRKSEFVGEDDITPVLEEQRKALREIAEDMVHDICGIQMALLGRVKDEIEDLNFQQVVDLLGKISVMYGISMDKAQLLSGNPTSINENRGSGTNIFQQFNGVKE